jgi:hypothetical protein
MKMKKKGEAPSDRGKGEWVCGFEQNTSVLELRSRFSTVRAVRNSALKGTV